MKVGNSQWNKKNEMGIHRLMSRSNIILTLTRVLQSLISKDCLKVIIDDQTEPQVVPKLLLQVSVRELHNILVSNPNYGGLKYTRDEDYNIIISDYTLCSLLPPQLKNVCTIQGHVWL